MQTIRNMKKDNNQKCIEVWTNEDIYINFVQKDQFFTEKLKKKTA